MGVKIGHGIQGLGVLLAVLLSSCLRTDYVPYRTGRTYASVDALIPPPVRYEFDTTYWNPLEEVIFEEDSALPDEAYSLVSDESGIVVRHGNNGKFRAQATLGQLGLLDSGGVALPYGTLYDEPVFSHRGVLLDVCRHFFTVDEVKRHLDVMAMYKFNVLHWHLTEDQGWRLAMEKYPKLAEVAAFRTHGDSAYGGYYTREDLEEVVAYAAGYGIEVIPEIEMPGHSQAALAAYPELGCTGEPVEVATDWGVFKDIYCAGNDQTFAFLEDVLDYVMDVFPSKYIHIGGDEAPKFRWEHCAKCQARMSVEGLEDEEALQRYFITRIEQYVAKNGKQIIGWDEILEGGLSPNATVQSWRGFEGAKHAAELGHDAIVSPTSHAYFDYPVRSIDVPKVYSFDPIPEDLDPLLSAHILGGECNLWSERIPDTHTLDRRFLPRALAMSEVLWAYPKERDYEGFRARMQMHYPMLESMGYVVDVEQVIAEASTEVGHEAMTASVRSTLADYTLRLTTNGQSVTELNPLPRGITRVEAQPEKDGQRFGAPSVFEFAYHEGLFTHSCIVLPDPAYKGSSEIPLADGRLGSTDYRDGNWLGYFGESFSGHWEFDAPMVVDSIKINFLQSRLSWILIPETVYSDFYVESDVVHRYEWHRKAQPSDEGTFIETMVVVPDERPIKKLNFELPNTELLPPTHPAAGQPVWHFLDEVQIYAHVPE